VGSAGRCNCASLSSVEVGVMMLAVLSKGASAWENLFVICNHVVWAPFVILRAIEGMVTIDVISLVALTFKFIWEYWES